MGVNIKLNDEKKQEVFSGKGTTDAAGNWEILIKNPLSIGRYELAVTAVDARGATSYPAPTQIIKVRAAPVISIGFVDLGWFEILIMGLLAALLVGAWFAYWRRNEQNRRSAYGMIAQRDIVKSAESLEHDAAEMDVKLIQMDGVANQRAMDEARVVLKRLQETVAKLKKYLPGEVEKIK